MGPTVETSAFNTVDVRKFTSQSGGQSCIYDFNSLISQLCHYYAIASEKFICFLWSVVDGRMMKRKPCFWRNMLQSGSCTRLPVLNYTQLRLSALPSLPETPFVDSVLSVKQLAPEGGRRGDGIFLITS